MSHSEQKITVEGKHFTIPEAVDQLGLARKAKHRAEDLEKKFIKELTPFIPPGTKVFGAAFVATVSESVRRTMDVAKLYKKLGKDKFLKYCGFTVTNAKKVLSEEEIDKMSKPSGKPTKRMNTDELTTGMDAPAPAFEDLTEL